MTNLEKELKRVTDKIIEYAYKDEFEPSYLWYKIQIMNEPNKKMHGCYYPTGANKYTVCLYQNAENKETDADRIQVMVHEVAHHLQHRRNRVDNNPKLYKNQPEAHKEDFWTEYQKLLYATIDLGYLTVEQMRERIKDEKYFDFVDEMLNDYEPHLPENPEEYKDEQIYVFNAFGAKDSLKARKYNWNSLNASWYITLPKTSIEKEKQELLDMGIDAEDIEVQPLNVIKMVSDEKHYKPKNSIIKKGQLELFAKSISYLLKIEPVEIGCFAKFNIPSFYNDSSRTAYISQYDDSSPRHCVRAFYQIAQHVYNAYQIEYSLDDIQNEPDLSRLYPGTKEYNIQAKGFALYIVGVLLKADVMLILQDDEKYDEINAVAHIMSNLYPYEKVINACIVMGLNTSTISAHLKRIIKAEARDYRSGKLSFDEPAPYIVCFDCETTGTDPKKDEVLQLSIINGMGEVLFNELIKPINKTEWPEAEKVNSISPDMVRNAKSIDYYIERIQTIFSRADILVGYNIGFDLSFLANAGIEYKDVAIYDVMKEFAEHVGEWDKEKKRYKWFKLTSCAEYFKYQWNGKAHDALADVQATLFCYYRIEELKRK